VRYSEAVNQLSQCCALQDSWIRTLFVIPVFDKVIRELVCTDYNKNVIYFTARRTVKKATSCVLRRGLQEKMAFNQRHVQENGKRGKTTRGFSCRIQTLQVASSELSYVFERCSGRKKVTICCYREKRNVFVIIAKYVAVIGTKGMVNYSFITCKILHTKLNLLLTVHNTRKKEHSVEVRVMRKTGSKKNHALPSFANYSVISGNCFLVTSCKE
jgi:hypothetical protein